MKTVSSLLLICLLTITGFTQSIKRLNNTTITPQALTARIRQLMDTACVTGMTIAVFNHSQPVYVRAFGFADKTTGTPMDTSTIFWACSYSKAVFAYCVMKPTTAGLKLREN